MHGDCNADDKCKESLLYLSFFFFQSSCKLWEKKMNTRIYESNGNGTEQSTVHIGNRTEWSPILSVII